MTGTTWIDEVGAFAMPIGITNTHAIGPVHQGICDWTATHHPGVAVQWMLPVSAETWDGYLNDINGFHVRAEHVEEALDHAVGGPVAEGNVGGGTRLAAQRPIEDLGGEVLQIL